MLYLQLDRTPDQRLRYYEVLEMLSTWTQREGVYQCGDLQPTVGHLYFGCCRSCSNKNKGTHNEQDLQDNDQDDMEKQREQRRDNTAGHTQNQAEAQEEEKQDLEEVWSGEE